MIDCNYSHLIDNITTSILSLFSYVLAAIHFPSQLLGCVRAYQRKTRPQVALRSKQRSSLSFGKAYAGSCRLGYRRRSVTCAEITRGTRGEMGSGRWLVTLNAGGRCSGLARLSYSPSRTFPMHIKHSQLSYLTSVPSHPPYFCTHHNRKQRWQSSPKRTSIKSQVSPDSPPVLLRDTMGMVSAGLPERWSIGLNQNTSWQRPLAVSR